MIRAVRALRAGQYDGCTLTSLRLTLGHRFEYKAPLLSMQVEAALVSHVRLFYSDPYS